jgi:DNA-binding LacI/PurR family transcriptional regulator
MPNRRIPLYVSIYRHYKTRILSGELAPGIRLPTEKEISARFTVSRITASRALKELEVERYIRRIKGSGSYVTEKEWRGEAVKAGKNTGLDGGLKFISLILPFHEDFSSQYLHGIEDTARKKGYFVTLHNTLEDSDHEAGILEDVRSRGAAGLIIYPASDTANLHMYSSLLIENYPFVVIDREIAGLETSLVCADNRRGFEEITSHLIEQGHRRIVFVGTTVTAISSEQERYQGFCRAHINHGVPLLKKNLYSFKDITAMPEDYRSGLPFEMKAAHILLDNLEALPPGERPTALAAVNDLAARCLMEAAMERHMAIPEKYSLTGFDNLPYAAHLRVPLATVELPAYEIGRKAAEVLFRKLENPGHRPEKHTIPPRLIPRRSAGEAEASKRE